VYFFQLQALTGMRAGEVVTMRPCDLDCTGEIWVYSPAEHKTAHRGFQRQVPLGAKSRAILQPFLLRDPKAFLFSPQEAEDWRNEQRRAFRKPNRKTKIYPSELKSRELRKQKAKKPSRRPKRSRFDVDSYRRAITYGLEKARKLGVNIPHWHPHQLRHAFATEVRRKYGVEGAQVALGHVHADVTQVYAERNLALASRIASEVG
jgi:integrase